MQSARGDGHALPGQGEGEGRRRQWVVGERVAINLAHVNVMDSTHCQEGEMA